MNVALFPSLYHPHVGGVETMCRALAGQLRQNHQGVMVVTNRWPRTLPRFETVDGIPVHRVPMRVAGESLRSKVTAALTGGLVRRSVAAALRPFRPDVLHVHCVSVNAAYALQAKKLMNIPLVVTLHGELTMDASQLFQRSAWARRVLRESLDEADAITACSGQTLAEAEAWYGKSFGSKGRVVYNGISLGKAAVAAEQPYRHSRPYVLAVGRQVPQKGFDLLLRAMAVLAESGETSHDLLLAGDGSERPALERLTAELNLGSRVVFLGRVDAEATARLFAGCSLFALPSRHEPFGIVNLEAMAAGKAVVAARVGGVPEVVLDGETGLLVPGQDVAALAEAIGRLIRNPQERNRLAAAGHQRALSFDWPAIAAQYEDVYRAISGPGRQRSVGA